MWTWGAAKSRARAPRCVPMLSPSGRADNLAVDTRECGDRHKASLDSRSRPQAFSARCPWNLWRNSVLSSLPVAVCGRASTNTTSSESCHFASFSERNLRRAAFVGFPSPADGRSAAGAPGKLVSLAKRDPAAYKRQARRELFDKRRKNRIFPTSRPGRRQKSETYQQVQGLDQPLRLGDDLGAHPDYHAPAAAVALWAARDRWLGLREFKIISICSCAKPKMRL